jgi:pimeloyl-ACP methyl ester carboxylesterase
VSRFRGLCLLALCGVLSIGTARVHAQGLVIAVDGSAHLRGIGDDLRQAIAEAHLPLDVESFAWSHGAGRVLSDLHGHDHQRAKGLELAERITQSRKTCPTRKVYLVCHSAGAAVVLAAAQHLPPGSVERIIFLAPALAPSRDLRPVLCCSRQGIDSFHSQNDVIGRVGLSLVGTADGQFSMSAASVGFTPYPDELYANLRQHAWVWEMSRTGYYGGHFGCTHSAFLRAYVVPLLAQP